MHNPLISGDALELMYAISYLMAPWLYLFSTVAPNLVGGVICFISSAWQMSISIADMLRQIGIFLKSKDVVWVIFKPFVDVERGMARGRRWFQ